MRAPRLLISGLILLPTILSAQQGQDHKLVIRVLNAPPNAQATVLLDGARTAQVWTVNDAGSGTIEVAAAAARLATIELRTIGYQLKRGTVELNGANVIVWNLESGGP